MIIKAILAGVLSYAVTCLICELLKKWAKRDDSYGGDGSYHCPNCNAELTYRDTITRVKCPKCQRYF
jgi:transposase-like protein